MSAAGIVVPRRAGRRSVPVTRMSFMSPDTAARHARAGGLASEPADPSMLGLPGHGRAHRPDQKTEERTMHRLGNRLVFGISLALSAAGAQAGSFTGPQSSQTPYVVPTARRLGRDLADHRR
ncbi:MAG: hypothetical protein MZV70_39760 [Desulfobacterales bacterium]|nr:hypothetical protein [Desulfobacterales bacterium]